MAIDTAAKRASAAGFMNTAQTLIFPDGTLDQGDRQTAASSYSGILAQLPPEPPPIGPGRTVTVAADQRYIKVSSDQRTIVPKTP